MVVFEHRLYDNKRAHKGRNGMSDMVVAQLVGESARTLAYNSCPDNCVVWEISNAN